MEPLGCHTYSGYSNRLGSTNAWSSCQLTTTYGCDKFCATMSSFRSIAEKICRRVTGGTSPAGDGAVLADTAKRTTQKNAHEGQRNGAPCTYIGTPDTRQQQMYKKHQAYRQAIVAYSITKWVTNNNTLAEPPIRVAASLQPGGHGRSEA